MPQPDKTPAPRSPAPHVDPVFIWPTPNKSDLIFWVERNGDLPVNKTWDYGDAYRDAVTYPNHQLIHVEPQTPDKWSRWFYASNRINEAAYNWEFNGSSLVRTYLVKRSGYPADLPIPTVGAPDSSFSDYVFVGDTIERADPQLDSLFILVRRRYAIPELVGEQWDEELERTIRITRTIVPRGSVTGSKTTGTLIEVQPVDKWYDIMITSEVVWESGDLVGGNPSFPIQLESVATEVNFPFPPKLNSVELIGAWAFAEAAGFQKAYAEDFYFEINIADPHPGPYDATVLRFITDDPDTLRASYPTDKITTESASFGLVSAWAEASTDYGNRASALAQQYTIPPTVHGNVTLPTGVSSTGTGGSPTTVVSSGSATLPATPGWAAYNAATTTIAGVSTRRSKLGLWEVQVTQINRGGANVYT